MAIRHDFGVTPFDPHSAAERLVILAMKDGAQNAVDWLTRVLERRSAIGMRVMPVWQLIVNTTVLLSEGVQLIPFSESPHSLPK